MINYRVEVVEDDIGLWAAMIYANSDLLRCYNRINLKDDAYSIGEAFIDGIKYARGEE